MAIRIFELGFDLARFQCLRLDAPEADRAAWSRLLRSSTRLGPRWDPPPVYAEHPNLEVPDIWMLAGSASFVVSPKARAVLLEADVIQDAELLPLPVGDEVLTLVNVVEVRNYLDIEKTKWLGTVGSSSAEVPEFVAHRIGGASLFKLPHDAHVGMYCYEDDDDPSDSFRYVVLAEGLTGLTFEEIWNSETGGRRPSSVPGV